MFEKVYKDSKNIKDACQKLQASWEAIVDAYERGNPGYTLWLTCTHRTPERQLQLFKQGRHNNGTVEAPKWVVIEPGKVVTNCDGFIKKSPHNAYPSNAIDVVVVREKDKQAIWDDWFYEPLEQICKDLGLEWGGTWKSLKDFPHIQIGREIAPSAHLQGHVPVIVDLDINDDTENA